ncbi:hypothetical protein SAMD00019534_109310 [Acytostelium subglobosum LB1]|uniref:hypothetical protein n=1 Tax=Acytostelium subglobosum LB1 TaxID=1410327 RepID=UPI0006451A84|nr:hypothetical protein SAMD00019534_109310 [Acytostelium subglobosum LB1]GAM27755.1 hypothetical protein SAMD00019534_109310 [Acytostelium subglobosum LB1]|eukprot:XP_012749414.1 hypothetical protein SAMD00019534_109310 [Acytostelium subglobosum LB1]
MEVWFESNQALFSNIKMTQVFICIDSNTNLISSILNVDPQDMHLSRWRKNILVFDTILEGMGRNTNLIKISHVPMSDPSSSSTSLSSPSSSFIGANDNNGGGATTSAPGTQQTSNSTATATDNSTATTSHAQSILSIIHNVKQIVTPPKNSFIASIQYLLAQSLLRALSNFTNRIQRDRLFYNQVISYKKNEGMYIPSLFLSRKPLMLLSNTTDLVVVSPDTSSTDQQDGGVLTQSSSIHNINSLCKCRKITPMLSNNIVLGGSRQSARASAQVNAEVQGGLDNNNNILSKSTVRPTMTPSTSTTTTTSTNSSTFKVVTRPLKQSMEKDKPCYTLYDTQDGLGTACISSLYGWDFEKKERSGEPFADCFCISTNIHPNIHASMTIADGSGIGVDSLRAATRAVLGANEYFEKISNVEIATTNELLTNIGNAIMKGHIRIVKDEYYQTEDIHVEPKGATTFCFGCLAQTRNVLQNINTTSAHLPQEKSGIPLSKKKEQYNRPLPQRPPDKSNGNGNNSSTTLGSGSNTPESTDSSPSSSSPILTGNGDGGRDSAQLSGDMNEATATTGDDENHVMDIIHDIFDIIDDHRDEHLQDHFQNVSDSSSKGQQHQSGHQGTNDVDPSKVSTQSDRAKSPRSNTSATTTDNIGTHRDKDRDSDDMAPNNRLASTDGQWFFMVGSVGDCRAFRWSCKSKEVKEVTNLRASIRNFNEAGGQLGWMWGGDGKTWPITAQDYPKNPLPELKDELLKARVDKSVPNLKNLHFGLVLVNPGDRVFIASDGVTDNFLTVNPGTISTSNDAETNTNISDDDIDINITRFFAQQTPETLATCDSMCQAIITHCLEKTQQFRNIQEEISRTMMSMKETEATVKDLSNDQSYQYLKKNYSRLVNSIRHINSNNNHNNNNNNKHNNNRL